MARIKSIAQRKHRKILKRAKGFKQARRQRVKTAKEAILHAGQYAYIGRRLRKRDMRALWIVRLSAAAKERGSSYSKLMANLKKSKIEIDRKILSDVAARDPGTFDKIVSFTS